MRKRAAVVLLIVLTGAAAIFVALLMPKYPKDPDVLAARFRECVMNEDAPCVRALTDAQAWKDNPISDEQLTAFLRKWVKPKFALNPKDRLVKELSHRYKRSDLNIYTWKSSDKKKQFRIEVAQTGAGVKVQHPLDIWFAIDSYPKDWERSSQLLQGYSDGISRFGKEVAQFGIKRIRIGLLDKGEALTFANASRNRSDAAKVLAEMESGQRTPHSQSP